MSRKKEIIKDAGIYALSSYIAQFIDMAHGILLRRFLGPTNMGIWAFLQVIQNYAKHSGLGVTTATARDVPYYLGKGDAQKADEVKDLVFTFTLIMSGLTALAVAFFGYLHRGQYSNPIFYGIFVVAAIVVLQRIYNLYVVLIRSHKEFVFAGFLNIASAAVTLILTLLLVWRFKLYGFYAALILHYFLMLMLIRKKTAYKFSMNFHWGKLRPIIGLGAAMVGSDFLKTMFMSIDRLMIAKYFGFTELGYYSIALMANNYLYALPTMLGVIVFPHFQEIYGKKDDRNDLKKYLIQPTLGLACIFPFIIGFVWFFSAWLVPLILPKYVNGISALRYLVLGSFFMAFSHVFQTFIITIRKHWQLIPLQVISVVFGFGTAWAFIKMGWGIEGVAMAIAMASLIRFLIFSFVSFRALKAFGEMVKLYARVFGIFTVFLVSLVVAYAVGRSIPNGFLRFVCEYAVFGALCAPLLWFAEKELKMITSIRHLFRDMIKKIRPEDVEFEEELQENVK